MDNIFYRVLLQDRIKIEPKYLSQDYRSHIQQKLKKQNEGVCTKHGYIREGSIDVYKIAPGSVDMVGLNGYVVFEVFYYADVCNPLLGHIVKAKVVNVNKFGILAEVAPIIEIIIAKNSVNIMSDDGIDLESIKPGDIIQVEILVKKFELNDKKISIVGRVVSQSKPVSLSPKPKIALTKDDDDEDLDKFDLEDKTDESESESEDEDESDDENDVDAEAEIDDEEEETQKGGAEFFESDDEIEEDEYEFFSDEDYDSDASVNDDDD